MGPWRLASELVLDGSQTPMQLRVHLVRKGIVHVSDLKQLQHEHCYLIQLAKEMELPVATAQEKIEKLNEKRKDFEQRMAVDLEESRRFKVLLDEEYLNELQSRREAILTDSHSAKSLMNLLAAVQLGYDRNKLLNMINPDPSIF